MLIACAKEQTTVFRGVGLISLLTGKMTAQLINRLKSNHALRQFSLD